MASNAKNLATKEPEPMQDVTIVRILRDGRHQVHQTRVVADELRVLDLIEEMEQSSYHDADAARLIVVTGLGVIDTIELD